MRLSFWMFTCRSPGQGLAPKATRGEPVHTFLHGRGFPGRRLKATGCPGVRVRAVFERCGCREADYSTDWIAFASRVFFDGVPTAGSIRSGNRLDVPDGSVPSRAAFGVLSKSIAQDMTDGQDLERHGFSRRRRIGKVFDHQAVAENDAAAEVSVAVQAGAGIGPMGCPFLPLSQRSLSAPTTSAGQQNLTMVRTSLGKAFLRPGFLLSTPSG